MSGFASPKSPLKESLVVSSRVHRYAPEPPSRRAPSVVDDVGRAGTSANEVTTEAAPTAFSRHNSFGIEHPMDVDEGDDARAGRAAERESHDQPSQRKAFTSNSHRRHSVDAAPVPSGSRHPVMTTAREARSRTASSSRPTADQGPVRNKVDKNKRIKPAKPIRRGEQLAARLSLAKLKLEFGWQHHKFYEVESMYLQVFKTQAQSREDMRAQTRLAGIARREANADKPDFLFINTAEEENVAPRSPDENEQTPEQQETLDRRNASAIHEGASPSTQSSRTTNQMSQPHPSQKALGKRKAPPSPTDTDSPQAGVLRHRVAPPLPPTGVLTSNGPKSSISRQPQATVTNQVNMLPPPMSRSAYADWCASSYDDFWARINTSTVEDSNAATIEEDNYAGLPSKGGARSTATLTVAPHVPSQYSLSARASATSPGQQLRTAQPVTELNKADKRGGGKGLGAHASFSSLPPPPPLEFGGPEQHHLRTDATIHEDLTPLTSPRKGDEEQYMSRGSRSGVFGPAKSSADARRATGHSSGWPNPSASQQEDITDLEALDAMFDEQRPTQQTGSKNTTDAYKGALASDDTVKPTDSQDSLIVS
ncbi:hypothetical protein OIO90_004818 [Microbotryomycetes sp. JL221]|nr:hypothetical protein OIO90_004818 [Microbotryomycetes sp. JL221]